MIVLSSDIIHSDSEIDTRFKDQGYVLDRMVVEKARPVLETGSVLEP